MKKNEKANILLKIPQEITLLIAAQLPRHNGFDFFSVDTKSREFFKTTPLYQNSLKKAFQNYLSLRCVEKTPSEDEIFTNFYTDPSHKNKIDSLLLEHVDMGIIQKPEWYSFFNLEIASGPINDFIDWQTLRLNNRKNENGINKILCIKFKFQLTTLYELVPPSIVQRLLEEKVNTGESVRICLSNTEMNKFIATECRKDFLLQLIKQIKEKKKNQIKIIDLTNNFVDIIEKFELHLRQIHTIKISELVNNCPSNIKIYLPNPLNLLSSLKNPDYKNILKAHPSYTQYPYFSSDYNPVYNKTLLYQNLNNIELLNTTIQFACENGLTQFFIDIINTKQFLYSLDLFENHKKIINIIEKNISPFYYVIRNSPYDPNLSFITALLFQLTPLIQSKQAKLIKNDLHWFNVVNFIFKTIQETGINILTYKFKDISKGLSEKYNFCQEQNKNKLTTIPNFLHISHKLCSEEYEKNRNDFLKNAYLISKLALLFLQDFLDMQDAEERKLSLASEIVQLSNKNASNYESFIGSLSKKLGKNETMFCNQHISSSNIMTEYSDIITD